MDTDEGHSRRKGTMRRAAPGCERAPDIQTSAAQRCTSLAHGRGAVQSRAPILADDAWAPRQRQRGGTAATIAGAARLVALLLALAPGRTHAQDSARTAADSIAERLRRAEQAIALLREQVEAQAESQVQAASRVRLDLFGRVLMNAFSNSGRVNAVDVPLFVRDTAGRSGLGASLRQTSFGVVVRVERVMGARFEGELHTDFYGGQQPSSGGRHFPLWRLRTARGLLSWERGELLVGQEVPLVNGLNPTSVAAFGTPEFTAAGNLWLWLPQVRGSWHLTPGGSWSLQGAVLAPASGDAVEPFDSDFDAAERAGRPSLQGRLRARWMAGERRGEVGIGVHQGWLRNAANATVGSTVVGVDALVPLGALFTLRGEWYRGRAARGLGGGGIGQGITTDGRAVRDVGGWLQLEAAPSTRLSLGAGCGVGDPDDEQQLPGRRLRNRTCASFVTVRPGGPVFASVGWRGTSTRYPGGDRANRHFNLAAGFEF